VPAFLEWFSKTPLTVRYRKPTAHVATRYFQFYQRSIYCQQPQSRRTAKPTATYPEDVCEWFQVEQPPWQS
jgi:hypothetical protein